MDTFKALIVDDETLSRKRIRRLLSLEPDIEVVGECANGQEAIDAVAQYNPDILFLDIQMPQMDAFGVVEALEGQRPPVVIFVTAYNEYAVKAFEVNAFDYLLKPFERTRFRQAVQRARASLQRVDVDVNARLLALLEKLNRQPQNLERIPVKTGGHVVFVRTQSIDWIEAADNYVYLHCGTQTHTYRETMNGIAARLDTTKFLRIHRSTIVNIDRIKELQPWFRGDYIVVLQDGTKLTLSRSYRERLRQTLLDAF